MSSRVATGLARHRMAVTRALVPRALIVDDDPLIRRVLARVLAKTYIVEVAERPSEAIARLEAADFDLLISDEHMPGGPGHRLLEEAASRWPAMRRLLISGAPPEHLFELEARGVVEGFVRKPFSVADVEAALAAVGRPRDPSVPS